MFALGIPGKETLKRLKVLEKERILSIWSSSMLSFVDDVQVFEQWKKS